jgi:Zn-dependent peptidase ImmA (M78 family)
MQNHVITDTHGETPYANINLSPNDIQPRDWEFLREWANNLGVSIEALLKRILIAAIVGQLYAEKIPEI